MAWAYMHHTYAADGRRKRAYLHMRAVWVHGERTNIHAGWAHASWLGTGASTQKALSHHQHPLHCRSRCCVCGAGQSRGELHVAHADWQVACVPHASASCKCTLYLGRDPSTSRCP